MKEPQSRIWVRSCRQLAVAAVSENTVTAGYRPSMRDAMVQALRTTEILECAMCLDVACPTCDSVQTEKSVCHVDSMLRLKQYEALQRLAAGHEILDIATQSMRAPWER